MGLFDVHAHLTHPKLCDDAAGVLARAQAAGVSSIISNGLNPTDNAAVLQLSREYDIVRPAFGLYPVDAVLNEMLAAGEQYPAARPAHTMRESIDWVRDHIEEAFAIGEIGLDGYWVKEPFWPQQEQAFRELVSLAMAADRAVIIHTRKRERRTLEILDELGAPRVNWHCFGGRVALAREIAQRGHFLSIPANARRSQSFTRMIETIDRRQLLLETDCPYLGPTPDTTNEPANVALTATYMAEVWGVSLDAVMTQLADNYERLFGAAP